MRQTLDGSYVLTERINERGDPPIGGSGLPALGDSATLGCLLALVRAAWGRPDVYTRPLYPGGWLAHHQRSDVVPTEAEALVVALEAAP
ncbi:MAG TPA: hypothetical protein VFV33_21835 [Gemmatimonadaceae bacterium]|nr:hypothetical protein [Gemmatimonadaceae bacterium]